MSRVDGLLIAEPRLRPWYARVLRAVLRVLDAGKPFTYVNVANELGVSRQAVQQMFIRHPDLLPWINGFLTVENEHYAGFVVRKTALLAMQGSDKHAEIYLRYMAGGYARPLPGEGGDSNAPPAGSAFVMNFLIPRPETPVIPGVTVREVPQLPAADIPTVNVNG